MSKKIEIRVDKPCSQPWQEMRPDQQGRFCGSCSKSVVDFTAMSDREMLDWFSQPREHVCGRFETHQLNRTIIPQRERKPGRLWVLRYLLAGLLWSSEASAQTDSAGPTVTRYDSIPPHRGEGLVMGKMAMGMPEDPGRMHLPEVLRGQVIDSSNGRPIEYVTIKGEGRTGWVTDSNGRFSIPRKSLSGSQKLTLTSIGYNSVEIEIAKTWKDAKPATISIAMNTTAMGDVVVIAGLVSTHRPRKKIISFLKDSLAFTGLTQKTLTVYPNPVARGGVINLSLRLDMQGTYTAQLFSTDGTLIETMQIEGNKCSKSALMEIPATLSAGNYFVRLSHPALRKPYTQQLLVK